ncbi:hypothetical protein EDC64_114120 [Aquabacter spiritensis]|uniref:Gas vesicle protein GvpC n=2 Tax=Aquabacter spiritensis TaxID=933073 RepID=A0A4R3LRJ5_9HYPH|nr:hypothetical protein EDC64_114120 [Aquabacter spiritensis]
MSLAGQISDTVTALASTRAARREALSGIRSDTARHLGEARAAHSRMATAQQQSLSEALRSTKLATAILLGAADEQIDGYRKERLKQAAMLRRDLSDGANSLRSKTSKWIGTQSAMRRKQAADDLHQRQRDRDALASDVRALTEQNLSFLAALTKDRQEASAIWIGRSVTVAAAVPAAPIKAEPPVKAEVKSDPAPEPVKAEPVKVEPAKVEPAKEPAKPEPVKAEPVKAEAAPAAAKPEAKPDMKVEAKLEAKPVHKSDKPEPGKTV